MQRTAFLLALVGVLAACSSGDGTEVTPTPTSEAAQTTDAATQTADATPHATPTDDGPDREDDLATAQALIDAWEEAGLPIGEVRDNTEGNCPEGEDNVLSCTALLTTGYVSVRVFIDETDAAEWNGPGREKHVIGRVNASFGGDSDFWPFDPSPYIDVMDEELGT